MAVAVNVARVVLGVLRDEALSESPPEAIAEAVMSDGPSTPADRMSRSMTCVPECGRTISRRRSSPPRMAC